jgi:hypothetical protein
MLLKSPNDSPRILLSPASTCFLNPESRYLNRLVLIPSRVARARGLGPFPGEPLVIRAALSDPFSQGAAQI